MRILLDECLTKKVKRYLAEFEVSTVPEAELSGLKNGKLLEAAVEKNFDILLTIDKNIDYQQNIGKFAIAIVILDVSRSHIRYIEPLIPEFKNTLGWEFFTLEEYLERIFDSKIDLVTKAALRDQMKDQILQQVRYIE